MSIKLVDSLQSMGDFPVAFANSIECADGTDLETKLSTLGGTGGGAEAFVQLSQDEYDALPDDETGKLDGREYRTYDTGHIYQLGVEFGKETDISSKQDSLSQVKFTMRRNSASEGRYCLIGSSDLSQNLLMCEPYRFQGIFGDGTTSVENKSIIDFMVSFREGVENPDDVLSGFANSSKGFDFVDLLITADETTNMAYAYVDFKTSGSVATGEITKPVLEAESYMDFAESFELVDTYQGTLVCKMSDYCKVITEIKDEVSDSTVWSSKKTSSEIDKITYSTDANECIPALMKTARYNLINTSVNVPNSNYSWVLTAEHIKLSTGQYYRIIQDINGTKSDGGTIKYTRTATSTDDTTWAWTDWVVDALISDTSSTTSTYSSAKIDEITNGTTFLSSSATRYIKFTLRNWSKADVIRVVDSYGGKIEIIGSHDSAYKNPKVIRYSYGDWFSYDGASTERYKIRGLYRYSNENCYYLEIEPNTTFSIQGAAITPEVVTELPVATSEMTLIPESKYASINDSSTSKTSTWSSQKTSDEIAKKADKSYVDNNFAPMGKVADVPKTNIAPADTTTFIGFAGNSYCNYCVRNGICFVTIWNVKIVTTGAIGTGVRLPKSLTGVSGGFFTGNKDGTPHAYGYVENTGELKFDIKDANTQLFGYFSYPVAES